MAKQIYENKFSKADQTLAKSLLSSHIACGMGRSNFIAKQIFEDKFSKATSKIYGQMLAKSFLSSHMLVAWVFGLVM